MYMDNNVLYNMYHPNDEIPIKKQSFFYRENSFSSFDLQVENQVRNN
jgi:hypothetical protein